MRFHEITDKAPVQDQEIAHYERNNGEFAIWAYGHFTIAELEERILQLREANEHFAKR